MKLAAVNNTNNNSMSFRGVVFHNEQNFLKVGLTQTCKLLSSEVVAEFKKKANYNLLINANSNGVLSFKIKSIGRGLKGFIKNALAPWCPISSKTLTRESMSEYIKTWHK